jgi:lysophospholipase L1-like esterase
MKRLTARIALFVAALALMAGVAAAQTSGSADFTRYVAIGDSLTHGYASGGVVETVQANSYPALIARQAGVSDFEQPLISEPGIPPLLELVSLVPGPVIAPRSASPGAPTNLNLPRPYNNLGVAGFRVHDVVATVTGNPLIDTVLRGLGTALQQTAVQHPTFVTVWIGNNDVLNAATSGRVIEGVTLTPAAQFEADYRTIIGTLRAVGANVAVATIPGVTSLPFVTTIPPVVVDPNTREPVLINGQLVPLIGPDGPLSLADRVLLTASSLLAQGVGVPAALGGHGNLPDDVVLNASEVAAIEARRAQFNDAIRRAASDYGCAVVPIDQAFASAAANGIAIGGGLTYTTDFLTGGLFSYDGVHPSPIGYAIAANLFIQAIDSGFSADIPEVDLYPFAFGSAGSAGATVPVTSASQFVFTAAAEASFRSSLRVPTRKQLDRYVRTHPQQPTTGAVHRTAASTTTCCPTNRDPAVAGAR